MASTHLNGLSLGLQQEPAYESDVEAELEVDQLDSDTDPEVDTPKSNTAKNGSVRPGVRVPGHTLLPAVRLENIIQADGTTGNMALSKEGLFILSIATEEFIKRLVQAGHREATAHRRNQINYTDMAATAQQYQEFMILSDTIPSPVSLADALLMRQAKERELLEDNPALAASYIAPPSAIPSPEPEPTFAVLKPVKKSRSSNASGNGNDSKDHGKGNTNGTASTSSKRGSKKTSKSNPQAQNRNVSLPHPHDDWPDHFAATNGHSSESSHNHRRSGRNSIPMNSAASSLPPPPANGHSPADHHSRSPQYVPEGGYDIDTLHSPPQDPDSRSETPPYETNWPGQFTGPASGFLRGSAAPYGHAAPQNPGRTIYSQNQRPD